MARASDTSLSHDDKTVGGVKIIWTTSALGGARDCVGMEGLGIPRRKPGGDKSKACTDSSWPCQASSGSCQPDRYTFFSTSYPASVMDMQESLRRKSRKLNFLLFHDVFELGFFFFFGQVNAF
ncbi:hypothetical protein NPIL_12801 [Nephila pilipes]|uniref:Uncharacterized protein n=1 Tax=Nephila pilipes TaxID=299642 RepID=A0A8X6PST1_NEPPI|nr:hypothetical protein NPIL_12801 [Nephila pilipes]